MKSWLEITILHGILSCHRKTKVEGASSVWTNIVWLFGATQRSLARWSSSALAHRTTHSSLSSRSALSCLLINHGARMCVCVFVCLMPFRWTFTHPRTQETCVCLHYMGKHVLDHVCCEECISTRAKIPHHPLVLLAHIAHRRVCRRDDNMHAV